MTAVDSTRPTPGFPQQVATRIAFFIAGFGVAAWAPLVPFAKTRLGFDEGQLGLLLLCLGAGSLVTMPITGILAGKFGCRLIITTASLLLCVVLPFLAIASTPFTMGLTLFLFGACIGTIDVAVNIQAVIVEKASGRSLMSGFHGQYSLGGIIGAGGMTLLLTLGLSLVAATIVIGAIVAALILAFSKNLLPYASESHEPLFVTPRGIVLFIGVLCFIVFLAEGSILDWSAEFLKARRGMEQTQAGLGYAAFATAMTIGRLTGDRIVAALGGFRVVLGGGLCAAAGFLLAVLVPSPWTSILGFTLVGAGASNIVPVLYTGIGKQKVMPVGPAISSVTTIGYAGILAGPAFIGYVGRMWSLEAAFSIVVVALVGVAGSARAVTR